MTLRVDDRASDFREIDRFDGGVGWFAHPEEGMSRASHALAVDDEVWVIDPVDAAELDDLLAEFGTVAGVVVTLDRHERDAAAVAARHDVSIFLPDWFQGITDDLDAPVTRFGSELADTGFEAVPIKHGRLWQEVALWNPDRRTLVVPESVGTASFFVTDAERLGVHPMLRAIPPREQLGGFEPDRVLVGHGDGVFDDAAGALRDALAGSRRRMPALYGETVRSFLPV